MSNIAAIKLGDDIVKVSIYFFSRLPLTENKTKFNRCFSRFFGCVLLLVSMLTISIQIICVYYQWQSVLDGKDVFKKVD